MGQCNLILIIFYVDRIGIIAVITFRLLDGFCRCIRAIRRRYDLIPVFTGKFCRFRGITAIGPVRIHIIILNPIGILITGPACHQGIACIRFKDSTVYTDTRRSTAPVLEGIAGFGKCTGRQRDLSICQLVYRCHGMNRIICFSLFKTDLIDCKRLTDRISTGIIQYRIRALYPVSSRFSYLIRDRNIFSSCRIAALRLKGIPVIGFQNAIYSRCRAILVLDDFFLHLLQTPTPDSDLIHQLNTERYTRVISLIGYRKITIIRRTVFHGGSHLHAGQ